MRSKTIGVLVFVLVLSAPLCLALGSVQVSSQSARSLELKLEIGAIQDIKDAGGRWAGLEVKDFISTFDSSLGLYAPVRSYIVAIPIGADVTCQVTDPVYYEIDPSLVGRAAEGGNLAQLGRKPADIAAKGYMGNQLVASLRISPLVYDDVRGKLRVYTRFGVRFDFGAPALGEDPSGQDSGDDGSYEATLRSALVNYEQGRKWRRRLPASLAASDYFSGAPSWIKIRIDTTGVYCITGQDLEALGVTAGSISAQTLRLYAGPGLPLNENLLDPNPTWMRQVPLDVSRATGALAGSDSIIFYALGAHDWKNLYEESFGPGEYNRSFYSDFNCYWLTWGGTFQESPARMAKVGPPPCVGCSPYEPPSFLERIHVEQDNVRDATVPAEDGWYWRPFLKGSLVSLFARTPLPDVSRPGLLKVRVVEYSQGDCPDKCFRIIVRLNSGVVGDWVWDVPPPSPEFDLDTTATLADLGFQRIDLDMPQSPPPGLTCTGICEKLYLAWYELAYWRRFAADRGGLLFVAPDTTATVKYVIPGFTTPSLYVFDVTDQFAVRQLTGAQVSGGPAFSIAFLDTTSKDDFRRYAVVSPPAMRRPLGMTRQEIANVRNLSGRAYLVITHKDLLGPAQTIADFHNGQVVTTDQIYDEFGWGVPDATAIRDFLRWRLAHGSPVARVLLFGDASYDIKGYLSYGTFPNYVPTYERRFLPPMSNPYATDDWLVYLEPAPGDTLGNCYWPTVPMARIPASSPEEGEEMVARILDYTTNPELGIWQSKIMLVADDDRIGTSCPADRSNSLHTIYAEQLSDKAYPQVFDRAKVYLTEYPIESTGLKTQARRAFIKALNEGVLVTNYVGHGDELRLAMEEVFNPASVNLVAAGRRLTFFLAASCNVSRFDGPAGSSMAEELFRRREGGTIGSLASTHLCFPGPNQALNMNFIFAMFDSSRAKHPTAYIADALQVAKVRTATPPTGTQSFSTNSEMYALFGDPAQRLASPKLDVVISKPASDTLERRSPYHFTAAVRDGGVPVTSFDGTAETRVREAEKTDGYVTCQGDHLDYELPGREIYRGKGEVQNGALAFDALIPVDAREGVRGAVRCFVSDGQNSGSGLLDSLLIRGESVSTDDVGPEIHLKAGGRELASGDSVVMGEHLTLDLVDDSGVAIKAKSIFIPAVSVLIDDGERQDITDSVYAVNGDFTRSVARFDVPSLTIDSHRFAITAFDNNNNVATEEYTLLVGSTGGQAGSVVYAYPNPAAEFCYVICECDRGVTVDVAVYTVSGRKIWEQASPEARSYHQIRWDGADTEGDKVANGTYLVKVEAKDPMESSFKFSKTIVVALIR